MTYSSLATGQDRVSTCILPTTFYHVIVATPRADDTIGLLVHMNDQVEDHYCHPQGQILKIMEVLKDLLCFPIEPKSLLLNGDIFAG
jgi:hypothetical protein